MFFWLSSSSCPKCGSTMDGLHYSECPYSWASKEKRRKRNKRALIRRKHRNV